MKQLKFEHQFAEAILRGERRTTLRLDDKHIMIGERLQLVDKVSSNKPQEWLVPGELKVEGVQEFLLGTLPEELLDQTELGRASKDDLYAFLRRFYGESIGEETVVKLITFHYEPYEAPVPFMVKEALQGGVLQPEHVKLFADGGSRGNPGPSASGFVVKDNNDQVLDTWNKYLGITTNNQAEYHALVAGLEWCKQHHIQEVDVYLDSLLAINQMKGVYKVKNRDLWTLYETAKRLQGTFRRISFTHVPRELNKLADAEVNRALDAVKGEDVVQ